MAKLIGKKAMNLVVSHLDEVRHEVHREAVGVADAADAGLAEARATTKWYKIIGPSHLTRVEATKHDVDSTADLIAPNAMAIEFGHAPSGVFGPGGRYEHVQTKAPEGLYILHRAAGFGL